MLTNSAAERRAFLVGMTLNELVFLLFFLLLIVSAVVLHEKGGETEQQAERVRQMERQLAKTHRDLDQSFKKLVLQEQLLARLQAVAEQRDPTELEAFFSRLVEDHGQAERSQQALGRLQTRVDTLQQHSQTLQDIRHSLQQAGIDGQPAQAVEQLLAGAETAEQAQRDLQSRLQYVSNRLKAYQGGGVDHPPCWVDPVSGKIEYLYRIVLLNNGLAVDAAWPESRQASAVALPGVLDLVGRTVDQREFLRLARPVYHWSRQHDCRHFVRVVDAPDTSKQTFKERLRTVETYFYKLLERG